MIRICAMFFLLVAIVRTTVNSCNGQGCNDAGLCTASGLDANTRTDSSYQKLELKHIFGLGEKQTLWFTLEAGIELQVAKAHSFQFRLPFHFIHGNLGNKSGLGDALTAFNVLVFKRNNYQILATMAAKFPATHASEKRNRLPLPMAYQRSQGTWDCIGGMTLRTGQWALSMMYQHNFNRTENGYIDSLYNAGDGITFFDSKKLDRGDDALLRCGYVTKTRNNSRWSFEMLNIWRFQKATIENAAGSRIGVPNSSGLTVNVVGTWSKQLCERQLLECTLGFPVLTRKARPDGLTRTLVFSVAIAWQ